MTSQNRVLPAACVAIACVALISASVLIGAEPVSPWQALSEWREGLPLEEAPSLSIFLQQRAPRTLIAFLAGAGLALAGCVFQALLRNPLAEPYTLGIASAGAFGAWLATVAGGAVLLEYEFLGFSAVQASAFAFALADVLLIYFMAVRAYRMSPAVLLLAGVTLGMIFNAGILLVRYFARPENLVNMDRWLMGGVDLLGYSPVIALAITVLPCAVVLIAMAPQYDQIGFGEDLAAGRGVRVKRLQTVSFLIGSLLTGVIVSKVGPIGFVGLLVPHMVRAAVGSRHGVLMPLTALAGGAFLCLCDILARKLLTGETPIGIVTSLIGGPFFLYLLLRRGFVNWE